MKYTPGFQRPLGLVLWPQFASLSCGSRCHTTINAQRLRRRQLQIRTYMRVSILVPWTKVMACQQENQKNEGIRTSPAHRPDTFVFKK